MDVSHKYVIMEYLLLSSVLYDRMAEMISFSVTDLSC